MGGGCSHPGEYATHAAWTTCVDGSLSAVGLAGVLGAPLPSKGGGISEAPPGGVAIIVKMGIPARGTVLPKTEAADPLTHHLHHSTRWLHVQMVAAAEARPCLCRFQGPAGIRPSRIDRCLADVRTASLAGGA